jgi:hypothetical protein
MVIGVGIEFLGKAIDSTLPSWNTTGRSKKDFKAAINQIPSLNRYAPYFTPYDL